MANGQVRRDVVLQGVLAAPGRAVGPMHRYEAQAAPVSSEKIANNASLVAAEQARVRSALEAAPAGLLALVEEVRFSIGVGEAGIFEAQAEMAADRGAARTAHLYSPMQPGVLQLINTTVEAAHEHGKWVGICGEGAATWPGRGYGLGWRAMS